MILTSKMKSSDKKRQPLVTKAKASDELNLNRFTIKYRYTAKIDVINGIDPYVTEREKIDFNNEHFPAVVSYLDIANHLIFCCYSC